MRKMFRGASLGVTFALSASFAASVTFGDEIGKSRDDHDIALKAVERGEILPLETVLSEVGKTIHGEVVGIELERKRETWVYQIKIIAHGNSMIELDVDARTAKVLRTRGK
jgi:uncharacterized membrane protein YkoI